MGAQWTSVKGKTVYVLVNMSTEDRLVSLPNGRQVEVKALNALRINEKR